MHKYLLLFNGCCMLQQNPYILFFFFLIYIYIYFLLTIEKKKMISATNNLLTLNFKPFLVLQMMLHLLQIKRFICNNFVAVLVAVPIYWYLQQTATLIFGKFLQNYLQHICNICNNLQQVQHHLQQSATSFLNLISLQISIYTCCRFLHCVFSFVQNGMYLQYLCEIF